MRVQPAFRSTIAPVPEGVSRPLWSVMIPTHNCAAYLRETLASVLSQDPGPQVMQIEVVDDCSAQDDPEAVVAELGAGRVSFFRQRENVGHVRNFETCLQRARGQLIHLLHGDDLVREGFYRTLQQGFEARPEIGAAFCRTVYIDDAGNHFNTSPLERAESGVLEGWLETIASGQRLATPSMVVKREVYEKLGGFDNRCLTAEDWEMWVRIASHHPVWFETEPLALYRVRRPGSLTESTARKTRLIRAMRLACEVIEAYLPEHLPPRTARECLRRARNLYARWALNHASSLIPDPGVAAAAHPLMEALRCSPSGWVVRQALGLVVTSAVSGFRRTAPTRG